MLRKERQQPLRKGGLHESAFFVSACEGQPLALAGALVKYRDGIDGGSKV